MIYFARGGILHRIVMTCRTSLVFLAFAALCPGQRDPARLMEEPSIKAALQAVIRNEPHFIEEQIRICEIPAPPFKEEVRAREFERIFQSMGLRNVRIDQAGKEVG